MVFGKVIFFYSVYSAAVMKQDFANVDSLDINGLVFMGDG
jgi:hypothetical protein